MKTFKTEAAKVAALIKAELKEKFPQTSFSVKSSTFSGGDDVSIHYTYSETAPRKKEVATIAEKFKAGYFNSSEDIYEYTNRTTGPTVKWTDVVVNYDALYVTMTPVVQEQWGFTQEEKENPNTYSERLHAFPSSFIRSKILEQFE